MNYVIFMDDAVHINCVISMEYSRKTPQKPIKSYKAQLKIKELKHNINNKLSLSLPCILFQMTPMLSEHNWIQLEQQYFGMPNTAYNFRTNNPEKPASG